MGWVALRKQKIKRDGQYIQVMPGDAVPEAEFWPNLKAHEDQGFVRWIPKDPETLKTMHAQKSVETSIVEDKPDKKRGRPKKKPEEDPRTFFVEPVEAEEV